MTHINSVVDLQQDGEIAVIVVNSPPVNALSAAVRGGIARAVKIAVAEPAVKAIVLVCDGRTFIAGADVTEFDKPPVPPSLAETLGAIENATKPVVAALHGTALGGGLEIALAAHYRLAVPDAKLGLPEIKLGLIPGGGGTQRLPRLIGVERALDVILSGAPISGQEAFDCGAVDGVVSGGAVKAESIAFAHDLVSRGAPPRRLRDRAVAASSGVFERARETWETKNRGQIAWEKAIEAVKAAVKEPFDVGLAIERAAFLELRASAQSRALRYAFFAERQVARIPDLRPDEPTRRVETVGVIGAGTMGGGIAMSFLNAGLPVTLVETSAQALERGVENIRRNYESTVRKGRLSRREADSRLAKQTGAVELSAVAESDLVIEAVFEDMELKRRLFRDLDAHTKPGAILAINTSYLDVDAIAAETSRPQDVVGLHFFSPANVMRLLEIVRGAETGKDVVATALGLAKRLGKIGAVVGVCHGFVGNRILQARQREAANLLSEGAMPWDVDRVLNEFGFPMGPFAMSDLAGVDIGWLAAQSSSSTIKEILCERGRKGQKTLAGYHDYDESRKASPSAIVERIVEDFSASRGIVRRRIADQEILERCLYPTINEGAKILEEKVVIRASDIDAIWLNGYGWPAWRGGPMYYADELGLPRVVSKLEQFHATFGDAFKPAALLASRASSGGRLVERV